MVGAIWSNSPKYKKSFFFNISKERTEYPPHWLVVRRPNVICTVWSPSTSCCGQPVKINQMLWSANQNQPAVVINN
jgi:hypothetical protein